MFSNQVDFEAADFNSRTVFADAKFEISVPDFRDAKLREATEWRGASWPLPPKNNEAIQQHIYGYERLKAEMERLKKHEEEQFFFAKELRARRAREPRWLKRLPNYAYEILSDYGRSIARPTVWIFVLWLVGTALLMTPAANYYGLLTIDSATALSATNLIPLLPRKPLNAEDDLTATLIIICVIQSVLGPVLLFLLGLALRNRFRMK